MPRIIGVDFGGYKQILRWALQLNPLAFEDSRRQPTGGYPGKLQLISGTVLVPDKVDKHTYTGETSQNRHKANLKQETADERMNSPHTP